MRPHWTQNDVRVNGVQLHYYRTGQGSERSLVLVHGFSDNGLCWAPVARDLEFKYDVIIQDMRGHGLSQRVKPGDKVDMGAELADLIRALIDIDQPIYGTPRSIHRFAPMRLPISAIASAAHSTLSA